MSRDVTIVLKAVDEYSATLQKFNSDVGGITSSTGQLQGSTNQVGGALDGVTSAISGAIVAWAGWKGINAVAGMIDLGQEASIVNQTFAALTENIGGADVNMKALRQATGNTVDTITLLTGANKLLQMGLATNTDELSQLSEMAVRLGASMGMDATKALSDFSLMLANNSIMRLDQLGISGANVRRRMEELKTTMEGIDKSEAFKLAVLAEGQAALERLGDAATAAETPINRLKTNVTNLGQSFSQDLSIGANSLLGILEIMTGNNPVQKQQAADKQKAESDATAIATAYAQRYHEALGNEFKALKTADLLFKQSLMVSQQNPDMSSNDAVTQAFSSLTGMEKFGVKDEDLQKMQQITFAMLEQQKAAEATAKAQQDIADATARRQELLSSYMAMGGGDDRADARQSLLEAQDYAFSSVTGSDLAKTKDGKGNDLKPSEITSAMRQDISAINKDSAAAGQHIDRIELALTKGAGMAEKIKNALDNIKTQYDLVFKVTADDPNGILQIVKAVMGGTSLADMVRSNGGVVPGTTGSTGKGR